MYCPDCGLKNDETAQYCNSCGSSLTTVEKDVSMGNSSATGLGKPIASPSEPAESPTSTMNPADTGGTSPEDSIDVIYLILSFLFWPIGIPLWWNYKGEKPESSKNLLAATIAGFAVMLLIIFA